MSEVVMEFRVAAAAGMGIVLLVVDMLSKNTSSAQRFGRKDA
jgi:hypothetical protein